MHIYAFEKLVVWQESKGLIIYLYKLTAKYPAEEKFGLTNQLRRAALSVASNIAEGSSRKSFKDQAHFYQIAYGSLLEVLNQLLISFELTFVSEEELDTCRLKIESISNKLNALRTSILNK